MKSAIIREFEEMEIEVGDEIREQDRIRICAAVAGDTPEKVNRFYKAWYAVTNDGPGFGSYPKLPIRTK